MREYIRNLILRITKNIRIYRFCNIYNSAKIGKNTVIGSYTEIGDEVIIGEGCKIQAKVFIPKGVEIGNDVFVGPCVKFTNDLYPKAKGQWQVYPTVVEDGASIGAGATIICGVRIGKNAKIRAGALVTKNVDKNLVVYGIPARPRKSKWRSK